MKHTIHKIYWNYEKEEKWLNDLSARGLALVDYCWIRYTFKDSKPDEYIYRIQLLEHLASHPESCKYIDFVESTGVECVATYLRWVYFRKKAADGPFELYSDILSKIRHYKSVRAFWTFFAFAELCIGLFNVFVGIEANVSSTNIILGGLLVVMGVGFAMMVVNLTQKIRTLKKRQKIVES